MTKALVKTIQIEAEAVLQELAKKYGMAVNRKGGTIGDKNVLLKFEFAMVSENGMAETREATDFKAWAHRYGFKPEDLRRTFLHGGHRYRILGLLRKAHSFPILAERLSDGHQLKFAISVAKLLEAN